MKWLALICAAVKPPFIPLDKPKADDIVPDVGFPNEKYTSTLFDVGGVPVSTML